MPDVYKTLIETLPQKIFYKDCQSVYISCNKNFARDLHIEPETIAGKTDYDFFPFELAEKYRADDKRVISRGITEDIVENYVQNGHRNYVRTIKTPVKNEEGTIIGIMGIFWDITKSKQNEEDLKKYRNHLEKLVEEKTAKIVEVNEQLRREVEAHKRAEDKLRIMFDSASEAIITLDLKGKIMELNNATQDLYQYDNKAELIGGNALKLVTQKDHDKALDNFNRTIKEGKINKTECTFVTRNGNEFTAEMSSSLLKDKSGEPVEFFAILRDISERKHAEELLKESEMKYKILAENSLTGIYIHQDGKYVFVNEGFAGMHGYTREELIGKDYMLLNHPADRQMVKNRVARILQGENKWKIGENRRVKKDGTTIWCQLIVNVIDYHSKPAIMGNVIDITERKKAEEALADEATRRRILFEKSNDGIAILNQNGKVFEANQRFADMLGYSLEEVHQLYVWDWDVALSKEQHLKLIQHENFTEKYIETSHRRKDGSVYYTEINSNRVEVSGQSFIFSMCRDITERKKAEEVLADEATRRRILIEQSSDGIVVLDQDGKVCEANKRFTEMLGYSPEEMKQLHIWDWEIQVPKDKVIEMLREADEAGNHFESVYQRKDGTTYNVETSANAAMFAGQKLIFCVCRDITERKKAEEVLADEATRRRILIEQSSDGIVVLDQNGKVYEANKRFAEMLGYSPEEMKRLHVWDWESQFPKEQVIEMVRAVDEAGDHFESVHRRKDGTTYNVEISTNGAMFAGQKLIFCVCRDITERKEMEQKLSEMATHDALTGLPNRLLLTDRFDIAIAQAKRRTRNMAIMMLDLDHFKYVNDTLGHDIGDKLLKAVGDMLKGIIRKGDTIARMGGDEFVLLFPEINDLQNTIGIAQKILDDFKKPFQIDCHKILITTSIGIALYPLDGEDFETLMTSADKAMYFAKEEGRNNFKYANSSEAAGIV